MKPQAVAAAILVLALAAAAAIVIQGSQQPAGTPANQPGTPAPSSTPSASEPPPSPSAPPRGVIEGARGGPRGAEPPANQADLLDSLDEQVQGQGADENARLQRVRAALTAFDVERAAALAEDFVASAPSSGWARVALAWTLAERGRWWDAFQAYDEALAIDPALHEGHLHQGRLAAVRANAKAERDLIAGHALDPGRWRPFLGGSWERGEGEHVVMGRLQGLIDQGLCGLLWHEPIPGGAFGLSVELELDPPQAGERAAGLALGLPDARSGLYVVLRSWADARNSQSPQAVAFREQHGVWPRVLRLAQIQGDVSGVLQEWPVALPESGWVSLRVEVQGPALRLQLGELELPPLTNGSGLSGRLGLVKLGGAEARYRDFTLTPR